MVRRDMDDLWVTPSNLHNSTGRGGVGIDHNQGPHPEETRLDVLGKFCWDQERTLIILGKGVEINKCREVPGKSKLCHAEYFFHH